MKSKAELQGEIDFLNNVIKVNQNHKSLLKDMGNTTPELDELSNMQIQKAQERLKQANERLKTIEMEEAAPMKKLEQPKFGLKITPSVWEKK